jgi:hypothetical protein
MWETIGKIINLRHSEAARNKHGLSIEDDRIFILKCNAHSKNKSREDNPKIKTLQQQVEKPTTSRT